MANPANWFSAKGWRKMYGVGQTDKKEAMARSKALQDALNAKTKELQDAYNAEGTVSTTGRVLTPDNNVKQTIKSLNIPLSTGVGGTGLNV